MQFIIQTIGGHVVHDFAFEMIEAIRYADWIGEHVTYRLVDIEQPIVADAIPVGSLEFVNRYTQGKRAPVINIPTCFGLWPEVRKKFLSREVYLVNDASQIDFKTKLFVKSINDYKRWSGIVGGAVQIPLAYREDQLFVSEVIDIIGEWRGFVYKDRLVGLQNYSGEFTTFPDVKLIEEMIELYSKNHPPKAYTIDVAILQSGETCLIEIHPFVSCGTYGFRDYGKLPQMFIAGFNYYCGKCYGSNIQEN